MVAIVNLSLKKIMMMMMTWRLTNDAVRQALSTVQFKAQNLPKYR